MGVAAQRAAQGIHVRAGGAAHAQVNALGVHFLQGAELLGDDIRGVVGQHHAAGAQADALGLRTDVGDEHGRGRGHDGLHIVVLGVPHAGVAQFLCFLCQLHGAGDGLCWSFALIDGAEVQDGKMRAFGHGGGPSFASVGAL